MRKLILFLSLYLATLAATKPTEEAGIFPFWNLNSLPLDSKVKRAGWGPKVTVNYLTQPFDHFNPSDFRSFRQRYLINDEHFRTGGPLFIMVGGEWALDLQPMDRFMDEGTLYEIAAENGGLLLYPEHRYYGESQLFTAFTTDNLKFLSIEQALEDLARFIRFIKSSDPRYASAKVILTGASYSAGLASYFRQKFPELADGVWASSPATDMRVETGEYRVLSGEAYTKYGSQQCYDALNTGYTRIESMLDSGDVEPLEIAFKLCHKINVNNTLDVLQFINVITSMLASTVAASDTRRQETLCQTILSHPDPVIGISFVTDQFFRGPCINTNYQSYLDYFNHIGEQEHPSNQGARQWFYQTCTQFGTYQTSILPNQPFGRKTTVDTTISFCKDIYGFENYNRNTLDENTRRVRLTYGGLTPNVTRVFYTQGEIDPWRGVGIQRDLNPETPAMVITGASHCNDLYMWFDETPSMKAARDKIRELVKEWIR